MNIYVYCHQIIASKKKLLVEIYRRKEIHEIIVVYKFEFRIMKNLNCW